MKKNYISFLLFISVVLTISVYAYNQHKHNSDEMDIYASIFNITNGLFELDEVITLSNPSICKSNNIHYSSLPTETVKNFLSANDNNSRPMRLSNLEGKVPIVSWEDQKKMHSEGSIELFMPGDVTLLRLSRAGFNNNRTNAIVCIELYNSSYASGTIIYLEKRGKKWKEITSKTIWIT